jgi:6-phosphogluconolactonase
MAHSSVRRVVTAAVTTAAALAVVAPAAPAAEHPAGAVFVQTNAAGANHVVAFARHADGTLQRVAAYGTGGEGTGAGLGSQGAVVLSADGRWLLAVNAGSDELTSFRVRGTTLERRDVVRSGGDMPISVDVHGSLAYVVNEGGRGNVTGFWIDDDGDLRRVEGPSRPLSQAGADPAQVGFRPGGNVIVVTEKATNRIDTYRIDAHGRAHGPQVHASAAPTPFGFAFSGKRLIVSDAVGGAPDASGLSSYRVGMYGGLTAVTPFLGDTETAACWVAIAGRYAYTSNTGSGTIAGYRIGAGGMLHLLDADGVTAVTGAGSAPADADFARGGRLLYVHEGTGAITAVRRGDGGALHLVDTAGHLPASAAGLAAS